jgi:AcrR family transcriptional regulator
MASSKFNQMSEKLHPTAQALVDLAIISLESGGESAVRVDTIVKQAGVSITSLYHHFGDRHGLIEAAQAQRFLQVFAQNSASMAQVLDEVQSKDDLVKVFRDAVALLQGPRNRTLRATRSSILGGALVNESLLKRISVIQNGQVKEFATTILRLQEIGVIRKDISPDAISFWIIGTIYGRILSEVDDYGLALGPEYVQLTTEAFIQTLL